MNTLYLRIPAKLVATWPDGALAYALCSKDGTILREGRATLTELAKDIFKSKIVLLIAASDVTLLEIAIPAIPEAKLKIALPNLVEDQLISDSAESVLVLIAKQANSEAGVANNKRVVAVAERSWLQQLSTSLYALGAGYVKALPAQLYLPWQSGQCSVLMEEFGQNLSIHYVLRVDVDKGIGILLDSEQGAEKPSSTMSTISLLAPPGPIQLQLPKELMGVYKAAIEANPTWADRFTLLEINWKSTIAEVKKISLNLMSALNSAQKSRIQWRIWRWSLALAALTLIVNLVGLNVQYWGMQREADALKVGMTQTYKKSFPKSTVVPYPLDQMRKNLQIAQRNSGQPAADDFTVLLTGFGSAWGSTPQVPKIVTIEYKDSALLVQVKGDLPQESLKKALSFKGLSLKKNSADVWQVKPE